MADYTATTDMNLEQAITNGSMVNGENLSISNGAVVTVTESPSILMGMTYVLSGKLLLDGENISAGNLINFVGENGQSIDVRAQGTLEINGDWYSLGTTDGTNSQTFSLSTYWGGSFEDAVPAIWVETGRRIDFDNESGTLPEVDDWVCKTSDNTIRGRIVEVNEVSSYLVVKFLTGTLANDDSICVDKLVDNSGPDMQRTWTASVNNASGDIKEAGVYQGFANSRSNGTSYISSMGTGIGGFCFDHEYQTNTITMGSTAGGFVPPSGCNVRIPNVHISTSNTTDYPLGNTAYYSNYYQQHQLSTSQGGRVDLNISNLGLVNFGSEGAYSYVSNNVGACLTFGSRETGAQVQFYDCVYSGDPNGNANAGTSSAFNTTLCQGGAIIDDCLYLDGYNMEQYIFIESSNDIEIRRSILSFGGSSSSRAGLVNMQDSSSVTIDNSVFISSDSDSVYGVNSTNTDNISISDITYSASQDYTISSNNTRLGYFGPGTKGTYTKGIVILGSGLPSGSLFTFFKSTGHKLRCLGSIDNKVNLQDHSDNVIGVVTFCSGIDAARIWTYNGDLLGGYPYRFFQTVTMANDITMSNCSSGYNSSFSIQGVDRILCRGHHAGSVQVGSYGGILTNDLSGSYGRQIHDGFRSDVLGHIMCMFVPLSENVNNITVVSGSPNFQNDGSVDMTSGDQITVEQDYYSRGHVAFNGDYTATDNSAAWNADEWSNVDVDFQYDSGSGYNGTWLDARTDTNLTSITGSHSFDYDNEIGGPFTVGESLSWGTGGTAGTGLLSSIVDNGTTGTIDFILTSGVVPTDGLTVTGGTSSATCDVDGVASDASDIVDGVKVKFRFTATGTQNNMYFFGLDTTTTLDDQSGNLYPIDQDYVTVKITTKDATDLSVISDARVYLLADTGGDLPVDTLIFNTLTNASGIVQNTEFLYTSDQPVRGWARKATGEFYKTSNISATIGSNGLELTILMIPD